MAVDAKTESLASEVVDASIMVHRELGPGLLESVYSECLAYELVHRGHEIRREVAIPVTFRDLKLETGFRADMIVADSTLVELKAVESVLPVHAAQVITYLKLSKLPIGFLINFNTPLLKDGIRRFLRPDLLTH